MANIDKSFHNGGYKLRIAYTINSQNAANNSTNITAEVHLISKGSGYNINSSTAKSGTLSINGTSYSFSANVSLSSGQDKTLFTKTVDVPHNSDGTKTCSLSCSLDIKVTLSGTYYGTVSTSGSATFNTIGRTSPLSVSGSLVFGNEIIVNHSRASSAYTVTLRYTCGNSSGTIGSNMTWDATRWTIPKSLQSEIPKATSIGITIYCDTYNGNTLLGTTSTSFTCTIADDCKPSLGALKCSNPDTSGTTYYQGVSKLRVEVGYTKAYNSEIAKYVMEVDGQTITNYGYIIWSGTLTGSGAKNIKITITDQRGRSVSKTYSNAITVTAYSKPNITKFTCKRMGTDESGNTVISNLGTIGYFTYACSWHSSSSSKTRKFMYKPTTSSSWTTVNISNDSYTDYKFSTSLATGSAYDLRIQLSDQVCTVTQDIKMNNLFPLINLSADGTAIAFGKECNASNKFMVSMDASFNNNTTIWDCTVGGGGLHVNGPAQLYSGLYLTGDFSMDGNITANVLNANYAIYGPGNTALGRSNIWCPLGSADRDYTRLGGHLIASDSGGTEYLLMLKRDGNYSSIRAYAGSFVNDIGCTDVYASNKVYANGVALTSDKSLKTDIRYVGLDVQSVSDDTELMAPNVNITTQDMHEFIETLPMVSYRMKQDIANDVDYTYYGFVAQDILYTKVGSELVEKGTIEETETTFDEEGKPIDTVTTHEILKYSENKFTAFICGALQEEIKQRKALEEKVRILESKIN